MKMNLIIDVGNSRIKLAVFEFNTLKDLVIFTPENFRREVEKIIHQYKIINVIISSVTHDEIEEFLFLEENFNLYLLNHQTKVPFINNYKTPQTLGVDRVALVAAASVQFQGKNVLVIDAGTCITYDFLSEKNEYYGGAISPGLEMRLKAMHTFTKKLPLLPLIDQTIVIGNNTNNSIYFGAINGVVAEIEGFINYFKPENKKLTIVLTGGDTIFLAKRLKNSIFANPNFLLEGLNSILEYNLNLNDE
jgi:type III pantothenate kinase